MNLPPSSDSHTSDVALFARLLENAKGEMSPSLARYILTLGFGEDDQARMRDLADRNQRGALTAAERDDLVSYVRTGHLLALLHSKARNSLKLRAAMLAR
jgi:hypothetical protein